MNRNIPEFTSDLTTIISAIANLVSEYETLDGRVGRSACGRRTVAMERVSVVTFGVVTDYLDSYDMDGGSNGPLVEETLKWSLFVTDLMATAMLDYCGQAALHGHRPEDYRGSLRATLLNIWILALEELHKDSDEDGNENPAEDAGGQDDAGECGDIAA